MGCLCWDMATPAPAPQLHQPGTQALRHSPGTTNHGSTTPESPTCHPSATLPRRAAGIGCGGRGGLCGAERAVLLLCGSSGTLLVPTPQSVRIVSRRERRRAGERKRCFMGRAGRFSTMFLVLFGVGQQPALSSDGKFFFFFNQLEIGKFGE